MEDALEKVAKLKPVAVLMDLSMPGMDGREATRRIKNDPVTAGSLVVVTGHAMGESLERASDVGADHVLVKPCLPEVVFEYVDRILAKRRL